MATSNDSEKFLPDGSLRRHAEECLRLSKRNIEDMPAKDVQAWVYELQVHQIELEMQNEELRRVQMDLEAARDRYVALYEFSPAGYLTLDAQGNILEANQSASALLGLSQDELIGRSLVDFCVAAEQDHFLRHCQDVLKTGLRQTCEVQLRHNEGGLSHVSLESLAVRDQDGCVGHWRTAILDISARKRAEEEWQTQRAQCEAILDTAMDAIITVDEEERVVLFNRAAESMFLCRAEEVIGRPLKRFIPERFRPVHHEQLRRFGRGGLQPGTMQRAGAFYGLRANGEEFPFEASIAHVRMRDKQLFTVILRDITERKAAEASQQAKEAFTRAVLDSLLTQVCVIDEKGLILNTNEAWKQWAARAAEGARVGENYLEQCRREVARGGRMKQSLLGGIEAVLAGRQTSFSREYLNRTPEGDRWFLMRVTPLKGARGAVLSRTDISERVEMSRQLEDHVLLLGKQRMELESLAGKLITAQEQERKRIARELHDDFNQRLAALSLDLERLGLLSGSSRESPDEPLATIRRHVAELSDDLHDLAYRLHPSLLGHVGLEAAIRDHVAEFAKRTGLSVSVTAREVPAALALETATNLFRVLQESLQNVSKHAKATRVTVKLSGSSKGIGLSVRDNGNGFDSEDRQTRVKGIGLLSMQERVRLLGGFLRIHSKLGNGTKVCAWIPHSENCA